MKRTLYFENYYKTHFGKAHPDPEKELKSAAVEYSKFYRPFLPSDKDSKILDIGCGTGHFLYTLMRMGYKNFEGIDLAADNIELVQKMIGGKVYLADVFNFLPLRKNLYDLIHSRDVIEHIPKNKIIDFLQLIYQSLKLGGEIIIGTSNAVGPSPVALQSRYMDFTHEITFTEFSLEQILKIAGFQEIVIIPTELKFKDLSFKGKIHYIIFKKTDYFFRRLYLRLTGIRPLPKVLHWHMTAIAQKP